MFIVTLSRVVYYQENVLCFSDQNARLEIWVESALSAQGNQSNFCIVKFMKLILDDIKQKTDQKRYKEGTDSWPCLVRVVGFKQLDAIGFLSWSTLGFTKATAGSSVGSFSMTGWFWSVGTINGWFWLVGRYN